MAIEIVVDLPIENGGSFHSYVSLLEGIDIKFHITSSQQNGAFYTSLSWLDTHLWSFVAWDPRIYFSSPIQPFVIMGNRYRF